MNSVADVSREGIKLVEIDQGQLQQHVDGLVRDAVEEPLNALCGAKKYERLPDRTDYRAGTYLGKASPGSGV
jgi:transposase-like protein